MLIEINYRDFHHIIEFLVHTIIPSKLINFNYADFTALVYVITGLIIAVPKKLQSEGTILLHRNLRLLT